MSDQYNAMRISVVDSAGLTHTFAATGLHEDYEFTANTYTGELIVERVSFGPRGDDEWARVRSVVVGAWPSGYWKSVTQYS